MIDDVFLVIHSYYHWEEGEAIRAVAYVQHLKCLEDAMQCPLRKLTPAYLLNKQF